MISRDYVHVPGEDKRGKMTGNGAKIGARALLIPTQHQCPFSLVSRIIEGKMDSDAWRRSWGDPIYPSF